VEQQLQIRSCDIAVVGMACRFPGAPTVEKFWENLAEGRDTATIFSDEELLAEGVAPELLEDPRYVKSGQILLDIDLFDADLFKITSDEAEILDPQQRLFLECALEALENSGYEPEGFPSAIGVYAGAGMNTYLLRNLGERYRGGSPLDRYRLMLAGDKDFLSTRVSYKLNLRGPSVNVNTACSTSLVAVHMACLGLLSGECDMALAGAAHIQTPQVEGYLFQEGMIFSPDGRCRAFDAKAQGTVVGNGVGVVVLKRLEDAAEQADWIHAVIKGSAINNDGALKASYAAPSVQGQASAIAEAQSLAGCEPATISYIEAHGTGTALGDPVEVAALKQAFAGVARRGGCAIGSVKTNVGHLDVAAGMAGLIKTCLMLQRKRLVPSLYFETPNPEIGLDDSPFYINTALKEWETDGSSRRAGVSSFGIGGTNAHLILEEAAARKPVSSSRSWQLLLLSARSVTALEKTAQELARHLKHHPELELADVAYTLALGRRHYAHRLALACRDAHDAALTLALADEERLLAGRVEDEPRQAVFVFRQGLRGIRPWADELYRELPAFREAIRDAAAALGSNVTELLETGGTTAAIAGQYALASLLTSWNIRPAAIIAFGAGNLAAGCLAGCFPLGAAPGLSLAPPRIPLWSDAQGWITAGLAVDRATWKIGEEEPGAAGPLLDHTRLLPLEVDPTAGLESLLRSLGRLWTSGVEIDWRAFNGGDSGRRVPLPARPFERKRYWVDLPGRQPAAARKPVPKLRQQVEGADEPARIQIVAGFIQREIARILGTGENQLPDPSANLFDLGIDSLILIEVAAKLSTEMERPVSPSAFVDHFTICTFAVNLLATLGYANGARRAMPAWTGALK
jgi:phthiocerol/phenolphthiocerol synthesis type-I polyketide synthase E